MKKSRYTFLFDKHGTGDLMIMNYLTGSIDMVNPEDADELRRRMDADDWKDFHLADYMMEAGYLITDERAEKAVIRKAFTEFSDENEKTPIQLVFSVTLSCNFTCSYCYQEDYLQSEGGLPSEITDAFFSYVNRKFGAEQIRPYITLFGGEPLLNGESYKKNLLYFVEKARDNNLELAIVTNGFELASYIKDFTAINAPIKEIQVTLDGDRDMHDSRRKTKSGQPTFDRIVDGIDLALKEGYRINLRTVIDKENIASIAGLAQFAMDRGWLHYPEEQFETQLGRNYELHTCQKTDSLYNRIDMWYDVLSLSEEYPVIKEYVKPQFHGMRYLSENGELPMPLFDSCPAGKKEWAFDSRGGVYGCTASVGVDRFRLGSYIDENEPENEKQILEWQTRDVLTIDECKNCALSLSCGGGCGVLAANNNDGKIHSPDCRPVKELVSVGASFYHIGEE